MCVVMQEGELNIELVGDSWSAAYVPRGLTGVSDNHMSVTEYYKTIVRSS